MIMFYLIRPRFCDFTWNLLTSINNTQFAQSSWKILASGNISRAVFALSSCTAYHGRGSAPCWPAACWSCIYHKQSHKRVGDCFPNGNDSHSVHSLCIIYWHILSTAKCTSKVISQMDTHPPRVEWPWQWHYNMYNESLHIRYIIKYIIRLISQIGLADSIIMIMESNIYDTFLF